MQNTVETKQNGTFKDDKKKADAAKKQLRATLNLAIEVKSAFEIYAYHVISPEVFMSRIHDLVEIYKNDK